MGTSKDELINEATLHIVNCTSHGPKRVLVLGWVSEGEAACEEAQLAHLYTEALHCNVQVKIVSRGESGHPRLILAPYMGSTDLNQPRPMVCDECCMADISIVE
jgi:hypothetical protein